MRRLIFLAAAMLWSAVPALAADAPYEKLGDLLGTPKLAVSLGPKDKSQLLLKFVRDGEDDKDWTKMTTVSILKVDAKDTETAGRGVIAKLRDDLKTSHANVVSFDESPAAPFTAYFQYVADGEVQKGIIYSPAPGFVTVAQVGTKLSTHGITPHDVAVLKSLIHQTPAAVPAPSPS